MITLDLSMDQRLQTICDRAAALQGRIDATRKRDADWTRLTVATLRAAERMRRRVLSEYRCQFR